MGDRTAQFVIMERPAKAPMPGLWNDFVWVLVVDGVDQCCASEPLGTREAAIGAAEQFRSLVAAADVLWVRPA